MSAADRQLLASLLLAACAAPPPVAHPDAAALDVETPPQWSGGATTDGALEATWWHAFADSALTAHVERVLARNHDLHAAAARMEAALIQSRIAGAELWPTLDAGFNARRQRQVFVGFPFGGGGVPNTTYNAFGVSLSTSWELDLWGRVRAQEAAAAADAQAAAADLASASLSLAGQACKAWFTAIEARQQAQLAERTVQAYRDTLREVERRFERGIGSPVEVRLARANLHATEAELAGRRDTEQAARRGLETLAGDYPAGAAADGLALPDLADAVPTGVPAQLLPRRPDLAAAERRLAAAHLRVDQARAALYPRLALTASAGTNTDQVDKVFDPDYFVWNLGGNLLQPLFAGGRLRGEVEQNLAIAREVLATYASLALAAWREVETLLHSERLLAEQRAAQGVALAESTAAETLARQRYERGVGTFLEVLEAQRRALAAEVSLLGLDRARAAARVDLCLALGGGYRGDAAADNGDENGR